ncbi:hypothetical protein LTS09_016571 [Friedmanniomyces endolithicus]|nr:hypothetical protein LTS09_016571 [Friedmanniomyces endolithicus]
MSVSIAFDQRDSLARSLERRLPGTIAVHSAIGEHVRYGAGMPPIPSPPPSADYRPVFENLHTSVPITAGTPKGSALVTSLLYRDHYIYQHPELHTSHGIRYGRFGI